MISQTILVSSETSFDEQKKREGRCSCSNTVISDTQPMIPFVRDDLEDCNDPWRRFATQCSQYSVQSDSSSSSSFYYSSESKDLVIPLLDNGLESVYSKEVGRKNLPQTLETKDPIHLLENSDNEAKEIPEKDVSGFMSKGCTPRKSVLAIRDYPSRPGRFKTTFSEDLVQSKVADSRYCYDSELEDLMVSSPGSNGLKSIKSEEEEIPKSLDDNELNGLEETSEESENSVISMYNISLNSFGLSEGEEEGIDMPKVMDSVSDSEESCSTNSCESKIKESENLSSQCDDQFPETGPSTTENGVPKGPKQILIALVAASNCKWNQKKTASRWNTTSDTNKRKRKKC